MLPGPSWHLYAFLPLFGEGNVKGTDKLACMPPPVQEPTTPYSHPRTSPLSARCDLLTRFHILAQLIVLDKFICFPLARVSLTLRESDNFFCYVPNRDPHFTFSPLSAPLCKWTFRGTPQVAGRSKLTLSFSSNSIHAYPAKSLILFIVINSQFSGF